MNLITVTQAADLLDLSPQRVRQLIKDGRLPAIKIGRDWMITKKELTRFSKIERWPGRPGGK